MQSLVSRVSAVLVSGWLVFALSGCAAAPEMTIDQGLQKLDDAGAPCLDPFFSEFESLLSSDQKMLCRDEVGGSVGFTAEFFDDKTALNEALTAACAREETSAGPSATLARPLLVGENWVAYSDAKSVTGVDTLQKLFGGSITSLSEKCSTLAD